MGRFLYLTACFLVACLALAGCGTGSFATRQVSVLPVQTSPLPTATALPMPTALPTHPPTSAPSPTSTPTPLPPPAQILFLSTNDNWGETEPCG
jgi:hypothetical protein